MLIISQASISQETENNAVLASLSFTISDDTFRYVTATVEWGDGQTTLFPRQVTPITALAAHAYGPGTYSVRITAANFRAPRPDTAVWTGTVSFYQTPGGAPPVPVSESGYSLIGPIFPRPTGYPGPRDWNWQIATDNILIEEALWLLLTTSPGEYLGDSKFGVDLRGNIFDPNDGTSAAIARTDITTAAARYVPSAQLASFNTQQIGNQMALQTVFNSLLTPGAIALSIPLPNSGASGS